MEDKESKPVEGAKEEQDSTQPETETSGTQAEQGKPDLSVGDLKHILALSLAYSHAKDDVKVKFDDAKAVIDLIIGRCPKPPEPDPVNDNPVGVISEKEYQRFMDLGLGRGVDATKQHPWQSKSSFQVRSIDKGNCKNIIGTEESGLREYYEEGVDSVLTQQFYTNFSVKEPSNSLVIGIYAEHSRSFAETRKAVGHKVMTRTVSFRTNYTDKDDDFEKNLSKWILERIETDRKLGMGGGKPPEGENDDEARLETYITEITQSKTIKEMQSILQHCHDFIEHHGVTHYVHTIKLGAAEYEVLTEKQYDNKFTATPSFEVNKVAKAVVSAHFGKGTNEKQRSKKVNTIGKIEDDFTVKKEPPYEAVLEIELKPLHSLVRMRALHLVLRWALSSYIKRRQASNAGPSMIACGPDSEGAMVYWCVDRNQVLGTTDIKKASLFYILNTEDSKHPHEFYIGYVGEDMSAQADKKGSAKPTSKGQTFKPTLQYLTADLKMMGWSNEPLGVTAGMHRNRARFTLHNSAVRKYAVTRKPVNSDKWAVRDGHFDSDKWTEGGGYFINCARRHFRVDGYVAMVRERKPAVQGERDREMQQARQSHSQGGVKEKETKFGISVLEQQPEVGGAVGGAMEDPYVYRTACKASVKSHRNDWPWMVFRLLPSWLKDDMVEGKLEAPSTNPITYRSNDRAFQSLFGAVFTPVVSTPTEAT